MEERNRPLLWRIAIPPGAFLEFGLAAVVIALKLALLRGNVLCARGLPHDDLLFLRLADYIRDGQWLGPYGPLTLVKVPFLPIFLAGSSRLGIPFLLSLELLYLAAAGLAVLALAPVVRGRLARVALFAWLAFNPVTLSSDATSIGIGASVITREPLCASLALLVIAAATGLWTYRHHSLGHRIAWSACLGCALGPFWLTREESGWIVPALVVGIAACAWPLLRRQQPRRARLAGSLLLGLPLVAWLGVLGLVATLNWAHYGVFIISESYSHSLRRAYGALTRVRQPEWTPNLPVPRAVRAQIYAESSAFAELRQLIEGNAYWFAYGCETYPHTCGDLTGGFFSWALRDAAWAKGHHSSAVEAERYYSSIADQIDAACEAGRLSCDSRRVALTDPIRWYHVQQFLPKVAASFDRTVRLSDVHIASIPCGGIDESYIPVYRRLTHHPVGAPGPGRALWQLEWSAKILGAYAWALPRLVPVALLGYVACLLAALRGGSPLLLPSTLLLLAVSARFALLAAADLVASVPYSPRYYQPNICLLLLFVGLGCYSLLHHLPLLPRPTPARRRVQDSRQAES